MNNLKKIWSDQSAISGIGVVKHKVEEISHFSCYIGTIIASKAKLFSIDLPKNYNVNPNYLKRFTGVEIQALPTHELVIILQENDLSDIFIMFIEDIIESISATSNIDDALIRISQRVSYWKRLFGKFSDGLLTPQQQRGLYGELVILEILLKENNDYKNVIEAWQAPTGTNQDFYFGKSVLEVKTSKSNHPVIKVANEFQLDFTMFDNLFVALISVSEQPNGKNTLLKKISEIRKALNSQPFLVEDFNLKLSFLGITHDLEPEYDRTSYIIRKIKYYKVLEDFPKIISSMVNNAVSHISYEISVNNCEEFETSFETIIKNLSNDK